MRPAVRSLRVHLSRYGRATARFLFTVGALVDFALAGTRWAGDNDMAVRLIAWGLLNLSIVFLFLDRDNPPEEKPADPPAIAGLDEENE